ncbi:MAG: flagellar brake domain-containing protein, partial [Desulfotignum sp.]
MEEIEGMLELSDVEGIYIDIGTQVYIEIDGVDFSVTSIFIGLLKNEFLIVTLPRRYRSVKTKLYPGSKMVVRYLYDGCVFAFQTTVIEILTNPIRTLALEYPKIVQQRELRIVKRNNVVIPGRVEARKTEFPIVIFDISKKGCRFTYHDTNNITTLKEGDIIRVY